AAVFRRGTGGHYFNHIWTNFPQGIEFRDQETLDQLTAGKLSIQNSIIFGNDAGGVNYPTPQAAPAIDIDEKTFIEPATGNTNRVGIDPGLDAAGMMNKGTPNFKPAANAAALTGGATPPSDGFFDATATFVGAVGADDWTAGWTKYPQN